MAAVRLSRTEPDRCRGARQPDRGEPSGVRPDSARGTADRAGTRGGRRAVALVAGAVAQAGVGHA